MKRATLINDIHWRFRADNSAIHQTNLTIRVRFLRLLGRNRLKWSTAGARGSPLSRAICTRIEIRVRAYYADTNSRDNASPSSGFKSVECLIREPHVNEDSVHSRQSKKNVRFYFLSKHTMCVLSRLSFGDVTKPKEKLWPSFTQYLLITGVIFWIVYLTMHRSDN